MSIQESTNNSPSEEGYRLVRKTYMCHVCVREFKQMAPVLELVEVECPQCKQTFCEEISTSSPRQSPTAPIIS